MGRGYGDWHDPWDLPSKPRASRGGIKARTRRGEFAEKWWAKRWQEVLARACAPSRLARGRAYARGGQVLSIDVGEGAVEAKVQGSRARPYAVSIKVDTLSAKERRKLADVLSKRALFAAKLLAGEMPPELEEAFQEAGLSLVPRTREIWTRCSCPDWDHPCKHVAAVFCLLGEEFDR
ncbi:MAG: SWIM zinc finger family protein, partial [Bacillota bacterium]|nr:SWIM zinc finger family protein [Bacillota bacterium]